MTALSLRNLKKIYSNGIEALSGIDLDVQSGDFFALLGPNGAGKSTTIGIISSLVNKTSGSVSIFGHDLDRDQAAAKRCIGLVPQEINFNQFESVQNILINQAGYYGIARTEARRRSQACLEQLELWDRRNEISRKLSGGMKRRLMIARALVHAPRLLILDEPTAGVDIEIRHSMWTFLKETNRQGTTIILTTHYLEEAENLCRNIAIIDQGTIVEHSSLTELLRKLTVSSVMLELRTPTDQVPELDGYRLSLIDTMTIRADIPAAKGVNALFEALTSKGISVVSIRTVSNRLEQLFMGLLESRRSASQDGG